MKRLVVKVILRYDRFQPSEQRALNGSSSSSKQQHRRLDYPYPHTSGSIRIQLLIISDLLAYNNESRGIVKRICNDMLHRVAIESGEVRVGSNESKGLKRNAYEMRYLKSREWTKYKKNMENNIIMDGSSKGYL